MKLIMAVSHDGYVAREPGDDMSWTGPFDKAVFRLLTCVGGELACGSKTAAMMPRTLAGRRIHALSTRPQRLDVGPHHVLRDLDWFQREHPNGWLVGGQSIAINALQADLVDEAFICQSDRSVFPQDGEACVLGVMLRADVRRHDAPWKEVLCHKVGDCTVNVWRRNRG